MVFIDAFWDVIIKSQKIRVTSNKERSKMG